MNFKELEEYVKQHVETVTGISDFIIDVSPNNNPDEAVITVSKSFVYHGKQTSSFFKPDHFSQLYFLISAQLNTADSQSSRTYKANLNYLKERITKFEKHIKD